MPPGFVLAFPYLKHPPGIMAPARMQLAKPAQLLRSFEEMPHVFLFTLDAGTPVWTEGGVIRENKEVGFDFDILWDYSLVAEYRRTSKASADLVH